MITISTYQDIPSGGRQSRNLQRSSGASVPSKGRAEGHETLVTRSAFFSEERQESDPSQPGGYKQEHQQYGDNGPSFYTCSALYAFDLS